jgi:hypothetical protein
MNEEARARQRACAARYGTGTPDKNALDEKSETSAAESPRPYCVETNAKLTINSMTTPTNATIKNSQLDIDCSLDIEESPDIEDLLDIEGSRAFLFTGEYKGACMGHLSNWLDWLLFYKPMLAKGLVELTARTVTMHTA